MIDARKLHEIIESVMYKLCRYNSKWRPFLNLIVMNELTIISSLVASIQNFLDGQFVFGRHKSLHGANLFSSSSFLACFFSLKIIKYHILAIKRKPRQKFSHCIKNQAMLKKHVMLIVFKNTNLHINKAKGFKKTVAFTLLLGSNFWSKKMRTVSMKYPFI